MSAPKRSRRGFAIAVTAVIVSAPMGWLVSDRLEADNDFCTSCHLAPDRPLHAGIRRDFDAAPAASLTGVHAKAAGERPFRCIDCHGGTGALGRARVKALAAKDAFWYAVGRFDEPDHMRWPLWDEDCRKCHADFDTSDVEAWQSPRFHQLPVHNTALGVACVECHTVHTSGGNPQAFFLHASQVRTQCARCHSEFKERTP
jgi:nitrate/TMAO reductase-like tetraheme cytochrome c subunit